MNRLFSRRAQAVALAAGSALAVALLVGNERAVNAALRQMQMTRIVVAHRPETIAMADRVIVIANGAVALEDCALRIRTTVVSRPTGDRGVLDAGSKTLTSDPAEEAAHGGHGLLVEYPDARVYALSEEHGHVDFSGCARRPDVGEVVTVIPNHACGVTNLHDEVTVHRNGRVLGTWAVAARGRIR